MKEMKNFSANKRYLIINADDFGMCHSSNKAIFKMLQDKVISSTSIMPVCPWFEEAVNYSQQLPGADIGVHLTFTSEWKYYKWGPISNRKSLKTNSGYFPADCSSFEKNALKDDVIKEIKCQLNKVTAAGIKFTNIDNHMGSLYGLMEGKSFLPALFDICSELNRPFRFPKNFSAYRKKGIAREQIAMFEKIRDLALAKNVQLIDYLLEYPFFLQDGEDYHIFIEMIKNILRELKVGISELYIHPALESDEIKAINPSWEKRVMEYSVFYEDEVQKLIEQEGIEIISWKDLI